MLDESNLSLLMANPGCEVGNSVSKILILNAACGLQTLLVHNHMPSLNCGHCVWFGDDIFVVRRVISRMRGVKLCTEACCFQHSCGGHCIWCVPTICCQ